MTTLADLIEVPPTIRPGAKITFCGEAPGSQEVSRKEGFVGGSGKMLERWCSNVGIDISQCNKTNVSKRRPLGDNFGQFYFDPVKRQKPSDELLAWRNLLIAEVTKYRPNLFVALGNEALKALTPYDGILKYSGSILLSDKVEGLKVIPCPHPAFVMRDNWGYHYICLRYFKRIAEEAKAPTRLLVEPPYDSIIRPDYQTVIEFLNHISISGLPWYLDIETRGDTINCFGLWSAARPSTTLCVPIQTTTGPYWPIAEEMGVWRALSRAMAGNPRLRNQNIIYDLDYLLDYGCEPSGVEFDPMIAMNTAYPEFPKGLGFTNSIFTYHDYYKDDGKTWKKDVPDEKVWEYNNKDMIVTPKVSKSIEEDLAEMKLGDLFKRRAMDIFPIALEMERNRIKLNRPIWELMKGLLEIERSKVHTELVKVVGREINVKSPDQVAKYLFEDLRLPLKKKRGTQNVTTEENAIKELRAQFPNYPGFNLILKERHLRTKQSNYINVDFDVDPDGSYFLGFQPSVGGTKTNRWAFSESPKWRGASPQVIPKILRLMYEPPSFARQEEWVFWQRDRSQAEVRIVMWLSQCTFLRQVFNSGKSIHKIIGGKIWNKDPDLVIKDSLEYDTSKSVVHAYDYMMQAKRLAVEANMSLQMATKVMLEYGALVPEIRIWHKEVKETVLRERHLRTPMGRVRQCFAACGAVANTGEFPDEIWRDLVSYIPQSTVPDLVNEEMLQLWKELPWIFWHQHGHDAWLASGPNSRTQEVYEAAERAGNNSMIIKGEECRIPGEFSWGYLWGAMKKYEPGEDTSREAWQAWVEKEGIFKEEKITEKLYSLL